MPPGRPVGLAKTGGRQKGTPNRKSATFKEKVLDFFHQLIDDETEAKFWRYFMTGYVVDIQEDGSEKIIPIPLNPVTWAAFKRAVEYKRGMPIQPVAAKIDATGVSVLVIDIPRPERDITISANGNGHKPQDND